MRTDDDLRVVLQTRGLTLEIFQAGEGGSAVVHRATQNSENPPFPADVSVHGLAIKEYKDEFVKKREQVDRIRQDVDVGKAVIHSNIVKIRGLIEDDHAAPLLVMDGVPGISPQDWAQKTSRSWDEIRRVALGVIDALAALHAKWIMHRDVKPANIFVNDTGDPVLMDMGVVEIANDDAATLHTSVGDFIGSIRYPAPQFLRGEQFDFPDDVYSLGATLYLPVTGKEIFSGIDCSGARLQRCRTSAPRGRDSTAQGASALGWPIQQN